MSVGFLVAKVLAGSLVGLTVTSVLVLRPTRSRLSDTEWASQLREAFPYLALLVGVLVLNKLVRDLIPELSQIVGWHVTGLIYAIEGEFVGLVQSVATPPVTAYFSMMYLVGYVFLLTFPFVAYLPLPDLEPLKETAVAYSINYLVGLACYVLFVSYGPRNLIPNHVEPLLYATYPQTQILTSKVNTNTNVFPSLHTSLSVTVALQAWRTRSLAPQWTAVAIPVAASVVVSTMFLGIHWATDVVAGVLLAAASVALARRLVS